MGNKNSHLAPKIQKLLRSKLSQLEKITQTKDICIFSKHGEFLIANSSSSQMEGLLQKNTNINLIIPSLRNAAIQFGESLLDKDSLAGLHLIGLTNEFSMFPVSEYYLLIHKVLSKGPTEDKLTVEYNKLSQIYTPESADISAKIKTLCQEIELLLETGENKKHKHKRNESRSSRREHSNSSVSSGSSGSNYTFNSSHRSKSGL